MNGYDLIALLALAVIALLLVGVLIAIARYLLEIVDLSRD